MRHNFPYMLGVYLAVNAVPDVCLVVDGPDCSFFKAEYIHGNHDLRSTLLNAAGISRVVYTNVTFHTIIMDRTEDILQTITRVLREGGFSLVILTGMPMTTITDIQYDLLLARARLPEGTAVLLLPGKSLTCDWLDGYAQALTTLAEHFSRAPRSRKNRSNNVAVVGHFMHRTEADELANIAELRRILKALSLNLVSVWLGNESCESLRNIRHAETIISLPYGRHAASILAESFGAELVEVDVPFGFENTKRFIRTIADHYGRAVPAEKFIDSELREYAPALEWIIPRLFLHKKTFFAGAPHMLDGFLDLARMTGMHVLGAALSCSREFHEKYFHRPARDIPELFYQIPYEQWMGKGEDIESRADVIVTDSSLAFSPQAPVVEFGFPSYFSHALSSTPCLGFKGAVAFLEKPTECLFRQLRNSESAANMNIYRTQDR